MKNLAILMIIAAAAATALAQGDRIGMGQWKLVEVDGMAVSGASRAYIEIERNQTRFAGNTGCNRMFGTVDVQGRRVDFSNIGTTRMACVEPRTRRVEAAFVKALENADRFRERGNSLELYDRNRVVVKFIATTKQPPEEPANERVGLNDRKWVLSEIAGSPVGKLGSTAFVVFDHQKQSAGGNSSCNVFGGSYTSSGNTLKISDVMSTMMACVEDERMDIERQFLASLRRANRYEIVKNKLTLYRDMRALITLKGEAK